MKTGEIELLRHLSYHPEDIEKYWDSIKIAIRHNYKVKDSQMWMDYVKMLDRMGKDLHSPALLHPSDLQTAHDIYIKKVNRLREKERREKERKEAIADQAKFEELKSRYFGLEMTDGEIEIHSLDTIDEYYEVGNSQSLCVASSKYYLKEKSLVLVAYLNGKQIATIEISTEDYRILQCRAFANGICEYQDRIAAIIQANASLIAERKAA